MTVQHVHFNTKHAVRSISSIDSCHLFYQALTALVI